MNVIKGNLIPYYDDKLGEIAYSDVLSIDKLKKIMEDLISNLRDLLYAFFNYAYGGKFEEIKYEVSDDNVCEKNLKKLHALSDIIILFLRLPLIGELDPMGKLQQGIYVIPLIEALAEYVSGEPLSKTKEHMYSEIQDKERVDDINDKHPVYRLLTLESLPKDIQNSKERKLKKVLEIIKNSFEIVKDAIFYIPSDTRPGANTSSLLVHLILTSALTWGQLVYLYGGKTSDLSCERRYTLEIARLAGILHDIGKPINWKSHISESVKLVDNLLNGIVDREIIKKVKYYVENHHKRLKDIDSDDLLASLIVGNRYSNDQDKLLTAVKEWLSKKDIQKEIGERLGLKNYEEFIGLVLKWLGSDEDRWDIYEELISKFGLVKIKELNNIIIKELKHPSDGKKSLREIFIEQHSNKEELGAIKNLVLYKIDLRGIQRYIYSGSKLAEIVNGSKLVEYLQVVEFPMRLIQQSIPLETILYSAGGNIFLIIPENKVPEVNRIVNKTVNRGAYKGLKALVVVRNLNDNFKITLKEVEKMTGLKKLLVEDKSNNHLVDSTVFPPLFRICDSCRSRPASIKFEGENLCLTCYTKRKTGKIIHFGVKWDILQRTDPFNKLLGGFSWNKFGVCVLEFIAGHRIDELIIEQLGFNKSNKTEEDEITCVLENKGTRASREYMSYAIVKMDANAVGKYMAETFTLTHLVYKSFRIALATKLAIGSFINTLHRYILNNSKVKKDVRDNILLDIARIYLGIMYVGGDDILLLMPSYLALPFVHFVALEFSKKIGFELTVSAGVIAGKPKLNIWEMFEATEYLLEDLAKINGRKLRPKIENKFIDGIGSLAYIFWKSSTVTKYHIKTLIDHDYELGIRERSLKLSELSDSLTLLGILKTVLGVQTVNTNNYFYEILDKIYEIVGELHSHPNQNGVIDKTLKKLRTESLDVIEHIRRSIRVGINKDFAILTGIVRLERNYQRIKNNPRSKDRANAIINLKKIYELSENPMKNVPLIETLQAIDFILGGVIS